MSSPTPNRERWQSSLKNRSPSTPVQVVYIGGFGRSGSTLLERILGAVDGWTNVGELVDLPWLVWPQDEICGCGKRFSVCQLWRDIGKYVSDGWSGDNLERLAALRFQVARQRHLPALLSLGFGRIPSMQRSAFSLKVREYQRAYGQIYQAVAQATGASVVVDASKAPAHALALALTPDETFMSERGYQMSIVHLVRDPRAVAYSWSHRQVTRPQAGDTGTTMWTISPSGSANQWAALQSEMELIARQVETHRLRYEDLIAQPRANVLGLLRGLGNIGHELSIDYLEDHAVHLAPSHGLSGNPSRFRHGRIELDLDEEWVRQMPTTERRLVTGLTLPWLKRYGYDLRPQQKRSPQ
jgi:hypothetical protein